MYLQRAQKKKLLVRHNKVAKWMFNSIAICFNLKQSLSSLGSFEFCQTFD